MARAEMHEIRSFEVEGGHREVGFAIGRRFGDRIHTLFNNYGFLQEQLLPFHHSSSGQGLYHAFLELHEQRFPDYLAELKGVSLGAERPFDELFLVNLRGEYGGLMALERMDKKPKESASEGCTDCLVLTPDVALVGHNEDGTPAALGGMFVLRAKVAHQPRFTALCYPGFLPGNAFGSNAAGVLHTVDSVSPRQVRVGLGRHFLARALLDAASLEDAIERVTARGRAAGFTYNIGSVGERRLVSAEVSPDFHHIHEVQGHYVHTNHYVHLTDVAQMMGPSSRVRLARAQTLCQASPPAGAADVLSLLGDEDDDSYPVYRTASAPDGSATLCTGLFDLDGRQLQIYSGHPVRNPECHITVAL
jgi:hypothetical protein